MNKSVRKVLISLAAAVVFSGIFCMVHLHLLSNPSSYDTFFLMAQMAVVVYSMLLGLLIFIAAMSISFAAASIQSKPNTFVKTIVSPLLLCVFAVSCLGIFHIVIQSVGWHAKEFEYAHSDKPEPPIAIHGPVEFQVPQNTSQALPDSNDRAWITLGRVERGQVVTSLHWDDGALITTGRTLREDFQLTFNAEGHHYTMEFKGITNDTEGNNSARFILRPGRAAPSPENSSPERGRRIGDESSQTPGGRLTHITQIATGSSSHHNLALKSDGSIVGWGWNDYGQAEPPEGNDYTAIATGGRHSLALKADGSIVGWGHNYWGQADPPDGHDYIAIAACDDYSLALKADGSLIGWGSNRSGQIAVPDGNDYTEISAGWFHCLALKSDGTLVRWGSFRGEEPLPPENGFTAIASGHYYSLALKTDGSISSMGTYIESNPPEGIFTRVAVGMNHCLALKADGTVVRWGGNNYSKVDPPQGNNFTEIAAGWSHSIALKADGTVVGWGANWVSQAEPAK